MGRAILGPGIATEHNLALTEGADGAFSMGLEQT